MQFDDMTKKRTATQDASEVFKYFWRICQPLLG